MPDFRDILFVADYDHTLTGLDGTIPARNREAIAYFMEHGGSFTLCTGRSLPLFRPVANQIPMNAPAILFNGGCCYDFERESMLFQIPIDLDARALAEDLLRVYPEALLEIQEVGQHYSLGFNANLTEFCRLSGCAIEPISLSEMPRQVMKLAMYQDFREPNVANLFEITPREEALFSGMVAYLLENYGDAVSAVRSAPRIVDIQSARATKGIAARRLAQNLGKRVLVAAGDSQNDLTMLAEADYAFVPADASIEQGSYLRVCPCSDGAIADAVEYLANRL